MQTSTRVPSRFSNSVRIDSPDKDDYKDYNKWLKDTAEWDMQIGKCLQLLQDVLDPSIWAWLRGQMPDIFDTRSKEVLDRCIDELHNKYSAYSPALAIRNQYKIDTLPIFTDPFQMMKVCIQFEDLQAERALWIDPATQQSVEYTDAMKRSWLSQRLQQPEYENIRTEIEKGELNYMQSINLVRNRADVLKQREVANEIPKVGSASARAYAADSHGIMKRSVSAPTIKPVPPPNRTEWMSTIICRACQKVGHIARVCPGDNSVIPPIPPGPQYRAQGSNQQNTGQRLPPLKRPAAVTNSRRTTTPARFSNAKVKSTTFAPIANQATVSQLMEFAQLYHDHCTGNAIAYQIHDPDTRMEEDDDELVLLANQVEELPDEEQIQEEQQDPEPHSPGQYLA
jgi:hypothetical protein